MKRIITFICCLVLFATTASAISPTEALVDVAVRPIDYNVLLTGDAGDIDRECYPTGMELPTKYMDLYMFASLGSLRVSSATYDFLQKYYPTQDKRYTAAEIVAAQMYVAWYYQSTATYDVACNAADVAYAVRTMELDYSTTTFNVIVEDCESFRKVLLEFRNILNPEQTSDASFAAVDTSDPTYIKFSAFENTDYVRTMQERYIWGLYTDWEPTDEAVVHFREFIYTRDKYAQELGLATVPSTCDYSKFFHAKPVKEDDDAPILEVAPSPDAELSIDYGTLEASKYVAEFATGITESDAVRRSYNFRDYMLQVAVIAVIVCVIYLGVRDFIKKRKDPARRYKQWW